MLRTFLACSIFVSLIFVVVEEASSIDLSERRVRLGKQANQYLDAFHQTALRADASARKLHVVYWTPADREPAKGYRARLTRVMRHIQEFYADQMEANGFGRRTIGLDSGADQLIRIHLVRGQSAMSDYGKSSGARIRRECVPVLNAQGIDANRETILIFCHLGEWDPSTRRMRHRSPYYAGGNSISGTAWQLDEPIMDTLLLDDRTMMFDGEYGRISMGKHNSIFIGGVAHELGHALGLPHNRERGDERVLFGTALMGSGNRTYGDELRGESRGSFLTFASALRLASHPQFSQSSREMNRRVRCEFEGLDLASTGSGFSVSGRVLADVPVYGLIAYTDPVGGGDYDATTQCAIPNETGHFAIECESLVAGKSGELRLVACHVNGRVSTQRYHYGVGQDGEVNLSEAKLRLSLRPFAEAIRRGRRADAASAASSLNESGKRIAARIINARFGSPPSIKPADVDAAVADLVLTDAAPDRATVGWIGPRYDLLPDENVLVSVGNRVFERGIYAHAPATHQYRLGGKWSRFRGRVGLADGHPGSVVFVVLLDGTELWRSELIQEGRLVPFDIDVAGGGELQLVVENGGDGNGADWGVWIAPRLRR